MTAVLKHELKNYFHSLTAYVFGAGLLLAVGLGALRYNLQAAVSNFEFALSYFSIVLAVIVPILTCGSSQRSASRGPTSFYTPFPSPLPR
jgi:ABC-2 type transport system permease protein